MADIYGAISLADRRGGAGETFTPELSAVFPASLCVPPRMSLRASVTEDSPPRVPYISRCKLEARDISALVEARRRDANFYPASKRKVKEA